MVNSLVRLQRVNPGFTADNLLTMQFSLPEAKYPDNRPETTIAFYHQVIERVKALPGVQSAGMTSALPLTDSGWGKLFSIEGRAAPKSLDDVAAIEFRQVSGDYFKALGMQLVKGRFINQDDKRDSLPVAVINESVARRYFESEDPIGKRVWLGPPESMIPADWIPAGMEVGDFRFTRWTIVGVVKDVLHKGLNSASQVEMYTPIEQNGNNKVADTSKNMYHRDQDNIQSNGHHACDTAASVRHRQGAADLGRGDYGSTAWQIAIAIEAEHATAGDLQRGRTGAGMRWRLRRYVLRGHRANA